MSPPLEFGISITPDWRNQDDIVSLTRAADEAGFDLIGIQDHPYQWRFHDTWTLIAYLAGRTSRVRFFPDVVDLPLRPPAILAKAAASLDVLTDGRVELGLGAGGFWDAIEAMGGPRRTPGEAVEATEEAIDVIRLVWSGERGVRYEGRHYRLSGLHTGPEPAHDIGIWLGASGPRMLDLIGKKADGWVPSAPWAPPEALPGFVRRIDEAAARAGRDPSSIRRVYNLMGAIGPTTGERFVGPVPKVARLHAPGDLRVEDAHVPEAGPGELVIRVRTCSTCGTDAKIYRFGHHHISLPRVLGHEVAGEIMEVGPEVEGWSVGDRVQVIAAIPCGTCHFCRRGQHTVCEDLESIGYQHDGGFADFMRVPRKVLVVDGVNRIPEHVPFEAASLTEPLACVLNGQELARVGDGDAVVVLGAGPIGCLHVRLARARGAKTVVIADVNQGRLDLAARAKPDAAIDSSKDDPIDAVRKLTDGRGADVVITATGVGKAQEQALEMAAPRGRISLFGGLPKDDSTIRFDSNLVHYRELSVFGAYGSAPRHNREALTLIADGGVRVDDLITHRLPLADVHQAIETVTSGEGLKVVIEP